jgi:hypothetical protein
MQQQIGKIMAIQSTYARLFLGFSAAISDNIVKFAKKAKAYVANILPITLLTEDQVDQALSDPHNKFLNTSIKDYYVDHRKAEHLAINIQSDLNSQKVFIEETLKTLEEKSQDVTPTVKSNIDVTTELLLNQYKVLNSIQVELNDNETTLKQLQEQSDPMIQKHEQEWVIYRQQMLDGLLNELKTQFAGDEDFRLVQGEIDNLQRQDSLQELYDRVTELAADLPPGELEKIIDLKNPSNQTYFKLKAFLAIRSALTTTTNINRAMKKLNSFFNTTENEGKKLFDKQNASIQSLVKTTLKSITQTMKTNENTLKSLYENRQTILKPVASIEDLEKIRDKTDKRIAETPPIPHK